MRNAQAQGDVNDDLLPDAVVKLYREALDDKGLDFLRRGPRSAAEDLAYAQAVHPLAHRTAQPAPGAMQRRLRERGEIDQANLFVGPDGIVYRRQEDSGEDLAARIRRGFESLAGDSRRDGLERILAEGWPPKGGTRSMILASDERRSAGESAGDGRERPSLAGFDREAFAEDRRWWKRYFSDDPDENQPRAAIVEMPGGKIHIAVDPHTGEIETVPAATAPRFSLERAKDWRLIEDIPRKSSLVVIRYPNGDLYSMRNETGEELRVDSDRMLILEADDAQQFGLEGWMPYTRPKDEPEIHVPSRLPAYGGRRRRGRRGRLDTMIEMGRDTLKELAPHIPDLLEGFPDWFDAITPDAFERIISDIFGLETRRRARELYMLSE